MVSNSRARIIFPVLLLTIASAPASADGAKPEDTRSGSHQARVRVARATDPRDRQALSTVPLDEERGIELSNVPSDLPAIRAAERLFPERPELRPQLDLRAGATGQLSGFGAAREPGFGAEASFSHFFESTRSAYGAVMFDGRLGGTRDSASGQARTVGGGDIRLGISPRVTVGARAAVEPTSDKLIWVGGLLFRGGPRNGDYQGIELGIGSVGDGRVSGGRQDRKYLGIHLYKKKHLGSHFVFDAGTDLGFDSSGDQPAGESAAGLGLIADVNARLTARTRRRVGENRSYLYLSVYGEGRYHRVAAGDLEPGDIESLAATDVKVGIAGGAGF